MEIEKAIKLLTELVNSNGGIAHKMALKTIKSILLPITNQPVVECDASIVDTY
uniref:Uncharacterized protein n=1 Tax=viral metagenome TaxID=1070528 RepID=A0A6M3M4U5_9ZZZZ